MIEFAVPPLTTAAPQVTRSPADTAAATGVAAEPGVSFHDVLSALNPLQYIPVIGTIYRAITGDQIPEPLRRVGSLIVSGLLGGPIGAAINVVTTAAEKAADINLDHVGQDLLNGHDPFHHPTADPVPVQIAALAQAPPPGEMLPAGWSPTQLAAYGVGAGGDGTLRLGKLSGAEVLNDLELSRLHGITNVGTAPVPPEPGSADVLNGLELSRVRMALLAYGRSGVIGA